MDFCKVGRKSDCQVVLAVIVEVSRCDDNVLLRVKRGKATRALCPGKEAVEVVVVDGLVVDVQDVDVTFIKAIVGENHFGRPSGLQCFLRKTRPF